MLGLLLLVLAAAQVDCRTPDPLKCWVCGCPPSPPSSEVQDSGREVEDASQCTKNCTGPGDSGRSITCLTGACAKWRHEYAKYSETIVQRGCAEKSDGKQIKRNIGEVLRIIKLLFSDAHYNLAKEGREMNKCYQIKVLGVTGTQCNCDTHLCNSQSKEEISKLLLPLTPLLLFSLFQVPP